MDLGQARDGMSVLMGLPVKQYDWSIYTGASNYQSYTQVNSYVYDAISASGIVAAKTTGNSLYGLPANHWWGILGVYDVARTNSSYPIRLIKLRNPWGRDSLNNTKYTHSYHDYDSLWYYISDSERDRIGANVLSTTSGNDGIVFMTVLQFRTAFEAIDSSKNLTSWKRSYFLVLDDKS